jgi:hypothetical protein
MKGLTIRAIAIALLTFSASSIQAQYYSIDWFKIAGGGATSAGGVYSVSGTIGQHDADTTMTGGSYSLTGGFWPGIVIPSSTGEAPTLFIQFSGNSVIISWLPATAGFTLEETDSLSPPAWGPAPSGNPTSPIPVASGTKFYRLKKP